MIFYANEFFGSFLGDWNGSSNYLLNTGDTASGDYNFDSNTLFIDASTSRVGIGTTNPQNTLNVVGDINATGTIYQNEHTVLDATYSHLTNFSDDLGDRGYTHLTNFTDDILWTTTFNATGDTRWLTSSFTESDLMDCELYSLQ